MTFVINMRDKVLKNGISKICEMESAKSHALHAVVLACLACLCACMLTCLACFRAYLLACLACLHVWCACMLAYFACFCVCMLSVLMCLLWWNVLLSYVFACLACLAFVYSRFCLIIYFVCINQVFSIKRKLLIHVNLTWLVSIWKKK